MSGASCLKVKVNSRTAAAIDTFHRFVEMDIVEDEDFDDATRADERLERDYDKIIDRIIKRQ